MSTQREELLFTKALAKPEAERAAWLERECADDPALRQRVAELLAAYEEEGALPSADGRLQRTVTLKTGENRTEEELGYSPGDRVGRY
jgi:hypothetical protein